MVTQKGLERYMANIEMIAKEANTDTEATKRVIKAMEADMNKRRRQPAPPAPEGGISLSDAERKYNIPNETISRWVKRGYIPVIQRTNRKVYILESAFSKIADIYKRDAGRGSWIIKKSLSNARA